MLSASDYIIFEFSDTVDSAFIFALYPTVWLSSLYYWDIVMLITYSIHYTTYVHEYGLSFCAPYRHDFWIPKTA